MMISWSGERLDETISLVRDAFAISMPVVLPTDTLYGLAAPISDEKALEKILDLKGRPRDATIPIAVGSVGSIAEISKVTKGQMDLLKRALPGPVTFILVAKQGLSDIVTRGGTVAVRVVDHPIFGPLCGSFGPVALTSANLHGSNPLLRSDDIEGYLGTSDILIVEDDDHVSDKPSTIIDIISGEPRVLRKGKININELLGETDG